MQCYQEKKRDTYTIRPATAHIAIARVTVMANPHACSQNRLPAAARVCAPCRSGR